MPVSDSARRGLRLRLVRRRGDPGPAEVDGLIREAGPVVYPPRYDVWARAGNAQIELMMRDCGVQLHQAPFRRSATR